ncbi:hypothetical protein PILCRDRAFT_92415 [Piloderma croceum F 1598]|uniref:Peptidase C14 caspase domain-containing protein n=1 Tax=Piloderma croceum (strain F 1598) TaxID=765440 RepID=A0A0C3F436_PILCF|nr:hypothetical protein PILCRDRAFT_92415 [Piloderma croceum F 1598]
MSDSHPTIPKVHAILVGINKYAEQQSLKSAVKDAETFQKVLEKLGSEPDLTLLLDVEATQDSITEALSSLQKEEGVKEVGIICLTEFMQKSGISDQMLAKLFDRISKACSNNIIIFLDCLSRLFSWGNPSSFVVVAPCDATKTENSGVFTLSLCKILKEELKYLDLLTVQSLADKIQADMGSEVECYGRNVDRLVFNSAGEAFDAFISCCTAEDGSIILEAGSAHGVQHGAIYVIYRSNVKSPQNIVLTYLVVSSVEDGFTAKLTFPESWREDFKLSVFYAVASHYPGKSVKINLPTPIEVTKSSPDLNNLDTSTVEKILESSPYLKVVNKPEDANILVNFENNSVQFLWNGLKEDRGHVQKDGETATLMPPESDVQLFQRGLKMAARFNYHLSRSSPIDVADNFEVQLHKVKEESKGGENKQIAGEKIPMTDGLFTEVVLKMSETCEACLHLHNNTELSLWPYVFIFDPSNFSIYPWYSAKVPVPPKSTLTVGFGDEGTVYFYSRRPRVDLSYIKQYFYWWDDDTWLINGKGLGLKARYK